MEQNQQIQPLSYGINRKTFKYQTESQCSSETTVKNTEMHYFGQ